MNDEHNPTQESHETYLEPERNTPKRRSGIGKTAKHIMAHPIVRKGAQHAMGASKQFLHQTTMEERIIIIGSLVALASPFFAWINVENTVVRGIDYFFYGIGYAILATAIATIISVIMAILGKSIPRILGTYATFHTFMGWQLMLLGILGFTIIYSIDTLSFSSNPISQGPIIVIFSGLAILGSGLFEHASHKKSMHSKILPTMHNEDHSTDTEKALLNN